MAPLRLPWLGIALAAIYWIAGSALQALFSQHGGFATQLLAPEPRDFWVRSLGLVLLTIVGCYAHYAVARRRQTEQALHESEDRLRTVVGNVPGVLFALDRDGVFTLSEGKGLETLGLEPGRAVGRSVFERHSQTPVFLDCVRTALGGEVSTVTVEAENLAHEVRCTPLRDSAGDVSGVIGVATDVTECKRAELALLQSQASLNKAQQVARIGSWEIDMASGRITASDEMYRIFGVTPEEFDGQLQTALQKIHPDDRQRVEDVTQIAFTEGRTPPLEYRIVLPDGTQRVVCAQGEIVHDAEGKPSRMVGTVQDITERKQAEEALRQSEERYQDLYDNAPDMCASVDAATARVLECNHTLAGALGYAKEEIVGRPVFDLYHPDSLEEAERAFRSFVEKGEVHDVELMARRKDGSALHVSLNVSAVRDEQGNVISSRSVWRDITERKRTEKALRRTQEFLTKAQQVARIGSWEHDMIARRIRCSDELLRMYGIQPEEFDGTLEALLPAIHPDDHAKILAGAEEAYKEARVAPIEFRILAPDGTERAVRAEVELIFDDAGRPSRMVGTVQDITEHKHAEEALRLTQFATDRGAVPVFWMDSDARLIYANDAACASLGYTRDQLLSLSVQDIVPDFPAPEWRHQWRELRRAGSFTLESHHRTKDGRLFPVEVTLNHLEFDGKQFYCAFARDITERKQAEQALRDREEVLRATLEATADGILVVDNQWRVTYVNERFAEIWNLPCDRLRTRDVSTLLPYALEQVEEPEALEAQIRSMHPSERTTLDTIRLKDGRVFEQFTRPLVMDGGGVGRVVSLRDITERTRAENALRESEERLRTVVGNAGIVLFAIDREGTVTLSEGKGLEAMGLRPGQHVGVSVFDVYRDEPQVLQELQQALSGEERTVTAEFGGRVLEAQYAPLRDAGGEVAGVIGVATDITERTRTEKALRESESRFRATAETVAAAVFIYQGSKVRYANSAAEALTGYSRDELLGKDFWEIIHPDMRELATQRGLARQRNEDIPARYEVKLLTKAGDECWVDFTAGVVDFEGRPAVLGTAFDITERRRAEAALRRSEEKYRHFFENVQDIYFETELAGTIKELSPSVERYAYTREQLIGTSVLEIYADAEERQAFVEKLLEQGEVIDYELHLKAGDGRVVDSSVSAQIRRDPDGTPVGIEGTLRDITERKRMEKALVEQTRRDPLTGLLNHAAIVEELRELLTNGSDNATHTVAMVDVDGLKAANDTYGHQLGDAVLTTVAEALSRDGVIAGRYGGDEFVAILRDTDRVRADVYRRAVLDTLAAARLTDPLTGSPLPVVVSIGLAVYPGEADTIDDLIRLSDSAMYASRRQRPAGQVDLPATAPLGQDHAAEMVGQLVPLLTAPAALQEKVRLVAQRISAGAGYDAVNIDIFSQRTGPPNRRGVYADVPVEVIDSWRGEQRPMEEDPFLQLLFRTRRGIIVDDPQNDKRLTEIQRAVLRAAELRSAVVVPLFWGEEMVGVLSVASKRDGAFAARDVQFLTTVAGQVTAIVRMATLVEQLQSSSSRLEQAHTETVMLLAAAAEAHDRTTGHHLQDVRALTEALARELGHDDSDARALGLAAVLHDIGKIRVPDSILARTGHLAEEEWELMELHTVWGAEFLAGRPGFELAATIALSHHERWDGTGYPQGLSGDDIPEAATIVAVADSFDAITHDRPYRQARSVDEAVNEIAACAGEQFSPQVVDALRRLHERDQLPVAPGRRSDQAA